MLFDWLDDETMYMLLIAAFCIGLPVAGFALGGFTGGISMIFLSLIILPLLMFILGVGFFKRHDDIYG